MQMFVLPFLISHNYLVTGTIFVMIVFHMKRVLIFSAAVTIPHRIHQDIIINILRPLCKVPITLMRF